MACALALSACSSNANPTPSPSLSPSASPSPTVPVQTNLDGITVTGRFGKQPKITFATPYYIDQTQSKAIIPGNGETLTETSIASINYSGVDGRTGKTFDSSWSGGTPVTFSLAEVIPGFTKGLTGQKVGSRVLIAMPGADGYDAMGGNSQAGIEIGDTLVFVVDIVSASLSQPRGATVTPAAGLPTVTGDAASKPDVTIPKTAAPAAMKTQVLIKGTGAKVTKNDIIYARYVGYSWKTGQLIDDKFDSPESTPLSSTLPGLKTGLVGQTVGSRVMFVLPPKYGFPLGSNNPPVEAGDTVVYVVDVLYAYQQ